MYIIFFKFFLKFMATGPKDGDDFWNTSSSSGFNFDDEEDADESGQNFVFQSTQEKSVLPIQSVISKSSIDILLSTSDIKTSSDIMSPDEAVKKMLTGHKCSLEPYKDLSDKILLLDTAIEFKNGNVLTQVILFLKSTLEQNIFHQILSTRKQAVFQYAYELSCDETQDINAVPDLYLATGHFRKTPEEYIICASGSQHYATKDAKSLKSRNRLNPARHKLLQLEWQASNGIEAETVVELLVKYCKELIEKNKLSLNLLMGFKKYFEMDDMTFEWTIMNVLASLELWHKITDFFIKPNWFTKKNVLKTSLSPDKFVYGMSRHKPPNDVLESFLNAISDIEKAVHLAKRLKSHKFVIHYYINQRDRLALFNYQGRCTPRTEEYYLIEAALQATDKKWKN